MANIRKKVKKRVTKTSNINMTSTNKASKNLSKPKPVVDVIKMKPNKTKAQNHKKPSKTISTGRTIPKFYGLKLLNGGKKLLRQKRVVAILICLFLILTVVILSLSTPTGLPEYISNSFTSLKAGDGFPVQPEGGKILYSNTSKNNVFSLTDTNFVGFNKNGKEILTIQHGYDNPSSVVSKERSLVYNYKNKKYFINNYGSKVLSGELDNEITLGTICEKGYFAFATKSVGYAGQVDVFNKKGKKVYSWFSASDPISNILLSNNGKKLAVVTVSASNGYVKSTISCLKYSSASPIFKYELNGAVLNIKSYSNGFLVVLQNKVVYYSWTRGEIYSKDFTGDNISFVKVKDNGTNLIVRQKGIITNSYIVSYNKKQKEKFSIEYNGSITDIDCHNNLIYILSNRKITVLNSKNDIVRTYELENIANVLLVTKSGVIYCYNDTGVFKVN